MMLKTIALNLTLMSVFLLIAANQSSATNEITQAELSARIADKNSPLLIDARSVEEYQQSHVPGAINLPHNTFSELPAQLKIAKNDELVVYCESGRRAEIVIKMLEKQGYLAVRHLQGDMRAWRNSGLETE